jgi:hypothetical protein
VTSEEREEIRKLRKENFELRRANEILKAASVFFATELDPGAAARLAVLGPDGPPLTGRLRCAYKQRRLRGRAQPQAEQGVLPSTPSYTDLGAGSLEHDDAPASLARSALQRSPPKRFTRPTETTGAPEKTTKNDDEGNDEERTTKETKTKTKATQTTTMKVRCEHHSIT